MQRLCVPLEHGRSSFSLAAFLIYLRHLYYVSFIRNRFFLSFFFNISFLSCVVFSYPVSRRFTYFTHLFAIINSLVQFFAVSVCDHIITGIIVPLY